MLYKILRNLILASLLFCSAKIFAWNAIGHAVIAQIAYDNLTPRAKSQVDHLQTVFMQTYPKIDNFQRMAAWADGLKQDNLMAFDSWHFINLPFSPTHRHLPYYEAQNVAWAIGQFQTSLIKTKDPYNKALALAFLSHFVGDIEQPLHCSNRITAVRPKGDQGGNLYLIQSPYATNLHQLWDAGLGLYLQPKNARQILTLAHSIEAAYPAENFNSELADPNPYHWAKKSFYLAKDFVYQVPEGSSPTAVYLNKGQAIVEKQSALAAYRLAKILNQDLG